MQTIPTLNEARAMFLETLVAKSPNTSQTYEASLDRLVDYFDEVKLPISTPTADLPTDVLERFYTWLVRRYGREARATHSTYLAGARAFFRFLERRGWGPRGTTFERIRAGLQEVMGRGTYRTPRIDPGLSLLVTYVDSLPLPPVAEHSASKRLELLRDKALLHTLFGTGMRRQEVASLNRDDLAEGWADQAIILGKGNKERVVFFDEPTLEAIRAYLEERSDGFTPLFIRHGKGRGAPKPHGVNYRISTDTIYNTVKAYASKVGVEASPHDFRHAKASVMLNRGASLSEVQDILGHASPETTKRIYAHYEVSRLREAFDRFSVSAEELAKDVKRPRRKGPS